MDKVLVKLGMKYLAKKLDGKKTYIGAGGKILTGSGTFIAGVVGMLGVMFPDTVPPTLDYEASLAALAAGVAVISSGLQGVGLGHKMEKANKQTSDSNKEDV